MAGIRREGRFQLNYDSLNDTVTNLAGALILVVALVLGVTRPDLGGASGRADARVGKPIEPLLQKAEKIRLETQERQKQLHRLENRLSELRQIAEGLGRQRPVEPRPGPAAPRLAPGKPIGSVAELPKPSPIPVFLTALESRQESTKP